MACYLKYLAALVLLFILAAGPSAGQESIQALVDERYSGTESDEAAAYQQALRWLAEHPVDLNRAPAYRLARLPGVNLEQAQNIVRWRNKNKPFESLDELAEVPGIGSGTVRRIALFGTVGEAGRLQADLLKNPRYWTHDDELTVFSRLRFQGEQREGFRRDDGSGYLGDRMQYYQRIRYRSAHLELNLTQQKDAGERWGWRGGLDHRVGYVSVREVGRLRRAVVGHYGVEAGEGLLLGGGSLMGKGRSVLEGPMQTGGGLKPFGSSREQGYFQGAAATLALGKRRKISATGWGSVRLVDARSTGGDTVRYSKATGYHRTRSELDKKRRLQLRAFGSIVELRHAYGQVTAAGYGAIFGRPVVRRGRSGGSGPLLYRNPWGVSISHHTVLEGWQFFGEIARSRSGGIGFIQGTSHMLSPATGFLAAFRKYDPHYNSLFGSGFGESPSDAEQGVYLGIRHRFNERLKISGYVDQYKFHRPRYGDSRPSRGYDWLLFGDISLPSNWSGYLQVKGERNYEEVELPDPMNRIHRRKSVERRQTFRLHLEREISDRLRLRMRLDGSRVLPADSNPQYGLLIFQDLRWRPLSWLQLDLRLTFFETGDYESRVYQFENDLLYVMTNKMLHGTGRRSYLLVNIEPHEAIEIWLKYAVTRYDNQSHIGSGRGRIPGARQSKFGLQIRLRI